MVARFEEAFADLIGVKHGIAVNNGTTPRWSPPSRCSTSSRATR